MPIFLVWGNKSLGGLTESSPGISMINEWVETRGGRWEMTQKVLEFIIYSPFSLRVFNSEYFS
jgi:hypothetical protein